MPLVAAGPMTQLVVGCPCLWKASLLYTGCVFPRGTTNRSERESEPGGLRRLKAHGASKLTAIDGAEGLRSVSLYVKRSQIAPADNVNYQ